MKILPYLLLFLNIFNGYSQKETLDIYDAGGIEQLYIHIDEVFKINIRTSKTNKITITSRAGGEYYNDISLDVEVMQDQMALTSQYMEVLQNGYDKLSAHKVFSFEISIEIPEGLYVAIDSNIASVRAKGKFKYLQAQLRSGFCRLEDFTGNALVNTYTGGIEVETANTSIIATSRKGSINLPEKFGGKYKVELHSITGDIRVVIN